MHRYAVTLHLPHPLYAHYKHQAEQAHRTVEDELLRVVRSVTPTEEALPRELEEDLEALTTLSDDQLWQTAQDRLTREESAHLESLHFKRQSEALSDLEKEQLATLLDRYERAILRRAEAARLLAERGHDVTKLLGRA